MEISNSSFRGGSRGFTFHFGQGPRQGAFDFIRYYPIHPSPIGVGRFGTKAKQPGHALDSGHVMLVAGLRPAQQHIRIDENIHLYAITVNALPADRLVGERRCMGKTDDRLAPSSPRSAGVMSAVPPAGNCVRRRR